MKTKMIIAIVISAIATFSFTFSSSKSKSQISNKATVEKQDPSGEPAGGLAIEDKF